MFPTPPDSPCFDTVKPARLCRGLRAGLASWRHRPAHPRPAQVALHSSLAKDNPRICRIESTAALHEFLVSEALLEEVKNNPDLKILEEPQPLRFDERGNLF